MAKLTWAAGDQMWRGGKGHTTANHLEDPKAYPQSFVGSEVFCVLAL